MLKLTAIFLLLVGVTLSSAQNTKATKEESLKNINDLYKSSYQYTDELGTKVSVESATLEGHALIKKYSDGNQYTIDLIGDDPIAVTPYLTIDSFRIVYNKEPNKSILGNISTEKDAYRLKNYLEELIQLINLKI